MGSARRWALAAAIGALGLALAPRPADAYSVLAHEALVDALWQPRITSLIVRRFPGTTASQLAEARAYAYGGSAIQDLGYYPFGNHFFTNLVHYVRSGDFVEALIRDARDANEYAFALGALAHYAADNTGHPEATNLALPMMYPILRRKFGNEVTYAEAPKEHVIVEFSFDVMQTIGGRYLPAAYRQFVGFEVAKGLLERAFRETYGLEMKDVFGDEDLAIGSYRYAISQIVPALTETAWKQKHAAIEKMTPGITRSSFVFTFTAREYEREFGRTYRKPGFFARLVTVLYRIVPKIGPLRPLKFETPPAAADALFAASFRDARTRFGKALASVAAGRMDLANTDFDTGRPTAHGEYPLADDTVAELLDRLSHAHFTTVSPALAHTITRFYGNLSRVTPRTRRERRHWKSICSDLDAFVAQAPAPQPPPH